MVAAFFVCEGEEDWEPCDHENGDGEVNDYRVHAFEWGEGWKSKHVLSPVVAVLVWYWVPGMDFFGGGQHTLEIQWCRF